MDNTCLRQRLLTYLKEHHQGMNKATQSKAIEKRFHVSGRNIRNIVHILRCEGNPICSDENGYYYATTKRELVGSIRQLDSRIRKIKQARDGLESAISNLKDADEHQVIKIWVLREKEVKVH